MGNTNLSLNQANAPITVVAVACECTMALEKLAEPGGPQDVLGPFAGLSTPTAVRGLVEAILPSSDANWISTRYVQGVDGG